MALLFADGLDRYSSPYTDLAIRYPSTSSCVYESTSGRLGGGAIACDSRDSMFRLQAPASIPVGYTCHAAMWVNLHDILSTNSNSVWLGFYGQFLNGGGLGFHGGDCRAYSYGSPSSGLVVMSPNPFSVDTWHHVEISVLFHVSNGFFKAWVDGVLVIDYTGSTSSITTEDITNFFWCCGSNAEETLIDDLVVWSSAGSYFTHAQLGLHQIDTISINNNGSVNQFTPLSGNNYENIDESGYHDNDTTYNESSVVGNKDLFSVNSLSETPDNIFAVQVSNRVKAPTGTERAAGLIKSGSNESGGANTVLTSSYSHLASVFPVDPDTSAQWTRSAVEAAEIGIQHTDLGIFPPYAG